LNKQSQTSNKEWFLNLGVSQGTNNSSVKNQHVKKHYTGPQLNKFFEFLILKCPYLYHEFIITY